jgi:hypothetical protein
MNITITEELISQLPNEQALRRMKKEEFDELIKTLKLILRENGFDLTAPNLREANQMLNIKGITQEQLNEITKLKRYFYTCYEIYLKKYPPKVFLF